MQGSELAVRLDGTINYTRDNTTRLGSGDRWGKPVLMQLEARVGTRTRIQRVLYTTKSNLNAYTHTRRDEEKHARKQRAPLVALLLQQPLQLPQEHLARRSAGERRQIFELSEVGSGHELEPVLQRLRE